MKNQSGMMPSSTRSGKPFPIGGWERFAKCIPIFIISLAGGCPGAAPTSSPVPGGGGTPPPEEGVTHVAMQGNAFVPKEVTIKVGESVRWTNLDSVIHTTTSGDPDEGNAGDLWDSGDLAGGESFGQQFDEAGEFEYFCIPHANVQAMRHAKVIVEP